MPHRCFTAWATPRAGASKARRAVWRSHRSARDPNTRGVAHAVKRGRAILNRARYLVRRFATLGIATGPPPENGRNSCNNLLRLAFRDVDKRFA